MLVQLRGTRKNMEGMLLVERAVLALSSSTLVVEGRLGAQDGVKRGHCKATEFGEKLD